MPVYATKQNMIDQYGESSLVELTDRAEPPTGEISDAILDAALDDADVTINSYISKRYKSPVVVGSAPLRRVSTRLAFYFLHRNNYPDTVRQEYEDALDYLKQISRGDVVLDVAGIEPTSAPAQVQVDDSDRVFTRDNLKGF